MAMTMMTATIMMTTMYCILYCIVEPIITVLSAQAKFKGTTAKLPQPKTNKGRAKSNISDKQHSNTKR